MRGPTHAYMGLSPGLDFESKLFAKTNAAELLRAELSKPGYVPKTIALGANTDPYQPIERDYRIIAADSRSARASSTIRSASSPNRRWCCAISTS